MSNYCHQCRYRPDIKTGPNACPVTSLYWRFLIKHYDAFSANPRTALMIKHVDKMTEAEKTAISEYGEQLLHRLDQL
jgi:deoxyribodipyrimidine photolyase-related protein